MRAHRNATLRQELDRVSHDMAALDFHHLRAGSDDLGGIFKGLFRRNLITAERHVSDDERLTGAARHTTRVVKHIVQRYRQRGIAAVQHIAQ